MSIEWVEGLELVIDPDATLTYSFRWSSWLETGVEIAAYEIIADDEQVTIENVVEADGVVSLSISGVAAGAKVPVTCRITTDEAVAQTDDRTIIMIGDPQ
jgi:hypothetical protein